MPWFKLDDCLHSHPKWVATSLPARGLWATAASWCANHSTDGRVPPAMLRTWGATSRHATELVTQGLWERAGGGWVFHDWLHFQPSAEQVAADRAAARDRQRRAREKAASRRDTAVTHGEVREQSRSPRPDPTRPPTESGTRGSPPLAAVPEPQDHEGVDYEHRPPPRLGDGQQTQLLANLAQIRRTLHPTGDDAA